MKSATGRVILRPSPAHVLKVKVVSIFWTRFNWKYRLDAKYLNEQHGKHQIFYNNLMFKFFIIIGSKSYEMNIFSDQSFFGSEIYMFEQSLFELISEPKKDCVRDIFIL